MTSAFHATRSESRDPGRSDAARPRRLVQRSPACTCKSGGECAECRNRRLLQLQPYASTSTATLETEADAAGNQAAADEPVGPLSPPSAADTHGTSGRIADDDAVDIGEGRMRKTDFLQQLRAELCEAASAILDPELVRDDCPELDFWFGHYDGLDAGRIERTVLRYVPDAAGAASAADYIGPVVARVTRAVRIWAATGAVTELPESITEAEAVGGAPQLLHPRDGVGDTPQVVRAALDAGAPVPTSVRSRMEAAFGRDFGAVRLHTGPPATNIAERLGARAFTTGDDIGFAAGEYRPDTLSGRALLAHELAHTIQQSGGYGGAGPADEHEATAAAFGALTGGAAAVSHQTGLAIHSCKGRTPREDAGTAPSQTQTPVPEAPPPINRAGLTLTAAESTALARATGATAPASARTFTIPPRFVLHDAAVPISATAAANRVRGARGPLGEGATSWVTDTGVASDARGLFDPRRPTTTEFERGGDIATLTVREQRFREVWRWTSATEQTAALTAALAGLPSMTATEIAAEQAAARTQLAAPTPPAARGRARPTLMTTAQWAVAEVCNRVASAGAAAIAASPAAEPSLQAACTALNPLLAARRARLSSIVNVEISQETGSNCDTGPGATPLPRPAYSAAQYNAVVNVYLRATLEAGRFPEITTHFAIDRGTGGDHCDPRCFDLGHFYDLIRTQLAHPAGAVYGAAPTYGTGAAANVWWHTPVCGPTP